MAELESIYKQQGVRNISEIVEQRAPVETELRDK